MNFFKGLDCQKDKILEIACLITDTNLKLIAEVVDVAKLHTIKCYTAKGPLSKLNFQA